MCSLLITLLLATTPPGAAEPTERASSTRLVATGIGIVAGGLTGGLVIGGGSYVYGRGIIESGQCAGAGCEGAAGMMLFAPIFGAAGAALGAMAGGLAGSLVGNFISASE